MSSNPSVRRISNWIVLIGVLSLPLSRATSADYTWDGGTSADWGTLTNWAPNVDISSLSGNSIAFTGNTSFNVTNNNVVGANISGIEFTNDGTGLNTGEFTISGNSINLSGNITSTTVSTGSLTDIIIANLVLTTDSTITTGSNHDLTISGDISESGSRSIIKAGTGTLLLSGSNTFSGGIRIMGGGVVINEAAALGTGGFTLEDSNTALSLNFLSGTISGPISVTDTGDLKQIIFDPASAATVTISGNIGVAESTAGNFEIQVGSNGTLALTGDISGAGGLNLTGGGNVIISGTNSHDLGTQINTGSTVQLDSDTGLGDEASLTGNNATLLLGNNITVSTTPLTIRATGDNKVLGLTSDASSADYASSITIEETGGSHFDLVAGTDQTLTLSGNILNGTGGGVDAGITTTGSGTVVLSGINTYTGTTQHNSGTLLISGDNSAALGDFTVSDGATLSGEGTIGADTTLGSGGINLLVDASTSTALTFEGSLDLNGATHTITFDAFATDPGNGDITIFNYDTSPLVGGTMPLFTFAGSVSASTRIGGTASFLDTGSAIIVNLGFAGRTWDGDPMGANPTFWDIGANANWQGGDGLYADGDSVIFNDTATAAGPVTVTLIEDVIPSKISFENDTKAYIIGGNTGTEKITATGKGGYTASGAGDVTLNVILAGNAELEKIGSGNLTLTANNTFSGKVKLKSGVINAESNTALGTGDIEITGDGAQAVLDLNADNLSIANKIKIKDKGKGGPVSIRLNTDNFTGELSGEINIEEKDERGFQVNISTGAILTLSGKVTGGKGGKGGDGSGITTTGTGTLVLSNVTNDFTEQLGGSGTISVASIANKDVASHAGKVELFRLGLDDADGKLLYTGTGDSTDRQVQVGQTAAGSNTTGGAGIQNNGTGALIFTNAAFNEREDNVGGVGGRTLTLSGNNTDANEIQGVIQDNRTGSDAMNPIEEWVALRKIGAGRWSLSGANSYVGGTTVEAGSLLANNTAGSGTGTGAVTVSGGNLGGTGTISGATVVSTGSLGTSDNIDSLTFTGGLDLQAGSTFVWDLISNSTTAGDFDTATVSTTNSFLIGSGASFDIVTNSDDLMSSVDYDATFWDSDQSWLVIDYTGLTSPGTLLAIGSVSNDASDNIFGPDIGSFEITDDGMGIYLAFTPVPEPGTYAILALLLTGVGWVSNRRRIRARTGQ